MSRTLHALVIVLTGASFVLAQDPPIPPQNPVVETPPTPAADPPAPVPQATTGPLNIPLAPGERIISIDGVPVQQYQAQRTVRTRQSTGCPTCAPSATYQTQVPQPAGVGNLPHQSTAVARAQYMARTGLKDHPPGRFGTSFEGVGWSSSRDATPPTCIPGRLRGSVEDRSGPGWTLVGDAIARSDRGSFRVRLWNRAGRTSSVSQQPVSNDTGRRQRRGLLGGLFRGGLFRRR